MATTCMVLLVGGCLHQDGSFRTDPMAAAAQTPPRREDYSLESSDDARESSGEAVIALIEESTRQAGAGNVDRAAANLERALHIEPRNAFLYSRLAAVRMRQERYAEAESLAAKSNSLASTNPYLQEKNWLLIAEARRQQGDESGATTAEDRARLLREFIDQ